MNEKGDSEVKIVQCDIKQFEWRIPYSIAVSPDLEQMSLNSPIFSVADFLWQISLCQNWVNRSLSFIEIWLSEYYIGVKREYPIDCYFGLKKRDGSVEQLVSQYLNIGEEYTEFTNLIKKAELIRRKSEFVSGDVLTIVCTLKLMNEISNSIESTVLDEVKPLKLIKLDTLSENFKDLIANKESCDTTLHVHDKEYKVHRAVLIARSAVFAAMFLHDTSEKQTGIVNIPDCDPDSFKEFLEFLYSGKFERPSPRNALYLYETSDKYEVQELKTFCVEYLIENLSLENICDVAILADKYEEANLLSAAQDFFNKNLGEIFDTSEWDSLVKNNYRLSKKLLKIMSSKLKAAD